MIQSQQSLRLALVALIVLLLNACGGGQGVRGGNRSDEEISRAVQVNTQLGGAYLQRGQYEEALEKLQKALGYDSDYAPAHSTIAILYEQIGDVDSAEKHHKRAVRLDAKNANAQNNLGAFLCKIGKYKEAEKYFLNAASNAFYHTPEEALANAGKCLLRTSDRERAENYFREALRHKPDFADALYSLAELNLQSGEYLRARAFLQRYEGIAPVNADSLLMGFLIEQALGSMDDAESYAEKLRAQYPNTPQAAQLQIP